MSYLTWRDGGMMQGQPRYDIVIANDAGAPPSRFIELGYYFSLLFGIFASALQVAVPFLGVGMLAGLAALCVLRLRSRRITVYSPIAFPLACGISFILIQVLIHSEPLTHGFMRSFVTWMLALIVVHSLSLRPGFLHRFAFAAFAIGLTTLPLLQVWASNSTYQRVGTAHGVGVGDPNEFAAWFGFCAVYFAIVGIETKRGTAVRVASWLIAVGCLFIIGLTVSRGALLATAIAVVVALRRLLKHGFLPLLLLLGFSWIIYESGLFDRISESYVTRSTEKTGRFATWPVAIERVRSAPLTGVGVSEIATYVPSKGKSITPHNGLLFIALASGIIPLTFFLAFWCHAALRIRRARAARSPDVAYCFPLLIYTFLIMQALNSSFMQPWAIVTLCTAITACGPHETCCFVTQHQAHDRRLEMANFR